MKLAQNSERLRDRADRRSQPSDVRRVRRGGKPKGYKHDDLQRQLANAEVSDLRRVFLQVLNEVLPYSAFRELRQLPVEEVPAWADTWHIHAPCVLEAARDIRLMLPRRRERPPDIRLTKRCGCPVSVPCKHQYWYHFGVYGRDYKGQTRTSDHARARRTADKKYKAAIVDAGDPPLEWRSPVEKFSETYVGPGTPEEWRSRYAELNNLTVDTVWLDDALDSPIWPISDKPNHPTDEAQRIVEEARAKALQDDRVLAPIAANPLLESCDHFLKRARNHWTGRSAELDGVLEATGLATKAPSPRPGLWTHVRWVARYQVCGESFAEIALTPGERRSPQTVEVRIREIAKMLDLRLRDARPPGRPPKRPRNHRTQ